MQAAQELITMWFRGIVVPSGDAEKFPVEQAFERLSVELGSTFPWQEVARFKLRSYHVHLSSRALAVAPPGAKPHDAIWLVDFRKPIVADEEREVFFVPLVRQFEGGHEAYEAAGKRNAQASIEEALWVSYNCNKTINVVSGDRCDYAYRAQQAWRFSPPKAAKISDLEKGDRGR